MTPSSIGLDVQISEVSARWISTVLDVPEQQITDIALCTVGTGQVADTYRVSFSVGRIPRTFVVKLTSDDATSRATGIATANYLREVRFYSEVAPTLSVRVPRCHLAEVDDDGAEFVLVLDDLAPAVQGDQLDGCTVDQARAGLRQASRLHADTWQRSDLLALPYLATPSQISGDSSHLAELFTQRYPSQHTHLFDRIGRTFFAHAGELRRAGVTSSPRALVHGDFRLDNMLLDAAAHATIVDWQTIQAGSPMIDVAYFIATSFTPPDRRRYENDLIEAYHDDLVAAGITDYCLQRCFEDYQRHLWFAVWMGVAASLVVKQTDRGDAMFAAMVDRGLTAMDDHDTLRFLS